MEKLAATINFLDTHVPVLLSPALKTMAGGPLQQSREAKQICLISLVESQMLEPALYHNPYFVLPSAQKDQYLQFLQALRHTDQFALANISGHKEQCLIYPYKDYLMLVLITSTAQLVEPEISDWAAEAATISEKDVAQMRAKLESIDLPAAKARSTTF